MRRYYVCLWVAVCLWAVIGVAGQAAGADPARQADAAKEKALVLERSAAPEKAEEAPAPSATITRAEAQAVDPSGAEPLDDAITCLARTVYWEAKGEEIGGLEAIAGVVMNRLGHEGFPNTVCGVVTEGSEQGNCQFSWWCDGRPDDVEEEKPYAAAKEVARKVLNRQLEDRTGGALYFHHRRVSPQWAERYVKTAEVGDHLFYRPRDDQAK